MQNIKKKIPLSLLAFITLMFIALIPGINAKAASNAPRITYLQRNDILPKNFLKSYIRADIGYSLPATKINSFNYDNKPKGALLATLGTGHVINQKFKAEVTANYRGRYRYSHIDPTYGSMKQKFSSLSVMLNGYLSPKAFTYVTPYVMAGAGLAVNRAGNFIGPSSVMGECTESFAWQVGAGSLIKISKTANIDIMYKYVDLGKVKTSGLMKSQTCCKNFSPFKGKLRLHELSIGISYFF